MLLRLLFYLVLGWAIYYAITGLLGGTRKSPRPGGGEAGEGVDDVMTLCPECGTYFPSRIGTARRVGGEKLLFCDAACAEKYARRGGPPAG